MANPPPRRVKAHENVVAGLTFRVVPQLRRILYQARAGIFQTRFALQRGANERDNRSGNLSSASVPRHRPGARQTTFVHGQSPGCFASSPDISTISFMSRLLRSALHAALFNENELRFDRVAEAVVASCGLEIREIAKNPDLDPQSPAANDVWGAFTELTEYRLYEDLRRGWRVVQPNLENVGLLRVGYRGLGTVMRGQCALAVSMFIGDARPSAARKNHSCGARSVSSQARHRLSVS